jgi:hypothetical protein
MPKPYAQTRIQTLPVDSLKPASYNARTITAEAMRGLVSSMEQFGVLAFPVVNKRKNGYRLIGGHQRVEALRRQGVKEVPCVVVEFDDDAERQANFALNNRAIQGEFVPELTRDLLCQIQNAAKGTSAESAFVDLKLDNLLKTVSRAITLPDRQEPLTGKMGDDDTVKVSRTKALSREGACYRLGGHLLMCGAPPLVDRPPMLERNADVGITRVRAKGLPTDEYLDALILPLLRYTDGWLYAHAPYAQTPHLARRVSAHKGLVSSTILWVNDEGDASDPYADAIVSAALYFRRDGAPRQWFGKSALGNVFAAPKSKSDLPVCCYADVLANSAKAGDVVLDTNVESGASVIAAEKLQLKLRGYVWSARDMDAVRLRWALFAHGPGSSLAMAPEVEQ